MLSILHITMTSLLAVVAPRIGKISFKMASVVLKEETIYYKMVYCTIRIYTDKKLTFLKGALIELSS